MSMEQKLASEYADSWSKAREKIPKEHVVVRILGMSRP